MVNIQSGFLETGEYFSILSMVMLISSIMAIIIDGGNQIMRTIKRQPTHPGKIIKEDYLLPLSLTIIEMAANLGVSRKTLSKIINGRGAITPDMALRLSRAFDTTPDLWLNLQKNYDLWQAEYSSDGWRSVQPLSSQLLHSH